MTFLLLREILQWLRKRACLAPVAETSVGLVFSARGLKRCYVSFILASLLLAALVLVFHEPTWLMALPLLVAIGCVVSWPPEIVLDSEGLTQRDWWGRSRHMSWQEVSAIVYRNSNGSTFVHDGPGRSIRHSGCHAGQQRFQDEVMRRSGVHHIASWGGVPSLVAAVSSKAAASGQD